MGLSAYTHATSPIRRYNDVIIQKIMNTFRNGRDITDKELAYYSTLVNEVAPIINEKCSNAKQLQKKYDILLWVERINTR